MIAERRVIVNVLGKHILALQEKIDDGTITCRNYVTGVRIKNYSIIELVDKNFKYV